jgi:aminoglycoside phosphotransferase family enzyme/predicted kinase
MSSEPVSPPNAAGAHVVEDQSKVLAFLADPRTHGLGKPPIRIDTHGAIVFLAGSHAYKVKRAVRFPFMDLSTLEKRKTACEAEVAVNKADAPDIYLGAIPVTRGPGGLALGGSGEPVEWLVHMRRFDEQQTLDRVADRGELSPPMLAKLVRAILASHARAPLRDGGPAADSLRRYLEQNRDAFAENRDIFPAERAAALTVRSEQMLDKCWTLLVERGRAGFVRRCHGDLHLRNLVLLDGEPTLFDAIEFDDAIATGDVLYDLAFLLMDLLERGLRGEASLVLNRYLWGSPDTQIEGLAALPLFLSIRAAIRAKVVAAALPHLSGGERERRAEEARRYFGAASGFLDPCPPQLVTIGGLSGSGKTTLAAAVAPFIGRAPGAIHLRSDVERKTLAGVGETHRLPESSYTEAASEAVYASLRAKARRVLAAGYSAVVDAVHARAAERDAVAKVAADAGVPFTGLWLEAPLATLVERVEARAGDASDATAAVVRRQAAYEVGPTTWTRLPATGDVAATAREALRVLAATSARAEGRSG